MPDNSEVHTTCSRCGATFTCDYAAGKSRCWCFELPPVADLPDPAAGCLCRKCLCRKCLAELSDRSDKTD